MWAFVPKQRPLLLRYQTVTTKLLDTKISLLPLNKLSVLKCQITKLLKSKFSLLSAHQDEYVTAQVEEKGWELD